MLGRDKRLASGALEGLRTELGALQAEIDSLRGELLASHEHLLAALQVVVDDEAGMRRRLAAARAQPEYESPFTEPDPLVSVLIPTYDNYAGLRERSVPSALAQTHANIELLVVGDTAPDETGEVLNAFADGRIRYENLERRGPYPEDEDGLWFTAGSAPLNRAMELARGSWIAVLNDDDAYQPEFVESLLALARDSRCEVAYGKLLYHEPGKESWELGVFPPSHHQFGWQMAIQHGALRMYEYQLATHLFREPGDWNRVRRMLRTGVRFAMLDSTVGDYWPRRLWSGRA